MLKKNIGKILNDINEIMKEVEEAKQLITKLEKLIYNDEVETFVSHNLTSFNKTTRNHIYIYGSIGDRMEYFIKEIARIHIANNKIIENIKITTFDKKDYIHKTYYDFTIIINGVRDKLNEYRLNYEKQNIDFSVICENVEIETDRNVDIRLCESVKPIRNDNDGSYRYILTINIDKIIDKYKNFFDEVRASK